MLVCFITGRCVYEYFVEVENSTESETSTESEKIDLLAEREEPEVAPPTPLRDIPKEPGRHAWPSPRNENRSNR